MQWRDEPMTAASPRRRARTSRVLTSPRTFVADMAPSCPHQANQAGDRRHDRAQYGGYCASKHGLAELTHPLLAQRGDLVAM